MFDPVPGVSRPEDCLAGGGEMGALLRSIDWTATALGPVRTWPQSLRTAVSMMPESRFGMYIARGPGTSSSPTTPTGRSSAPPSIRRQLRRIRTLPAERGGRVPAIALTAYARPDARARALAAGFQDHVARPVDLASLTAALGRVLSRPSS
jgi:hypothetical protein